MDKSEQEKGKWNLRNSQLFYKCWYDGMADIADFGRRVKILKFYLADFTYI